MITSAPEMPVDGAIRSEGEAPIYFVREDGVRFVLVFEQRETSLNEEQCRDLLMIVADFLNRLDDERAEARRMEEEFGGQP